MVEGARRSVVFVAVLLALLLIFYPPAWLSTQAATTGAICLIVISLFATGLLPEASSSLLFFLLAMLLGIAPAGVVFSGFESGAFWIIFGGLILGLSIRHTGLGEQLARRLLQIVPSRYAALVVGAVAVGGMLAFLMPGSIGRVVLLVPVALAVADQLGFDAHRNGRLALALGAIFGTQIISVGILPASVPNVVWSGSVETLYEMDVAYLTYMLWNFPILGLLRAALLVGVLIWMLPDRVPGSPVVSPVPTQAKHPHARHLTVVLCIALTLWMTDVFHGIAPAWIALGAAFYCLIPGVGLVPERPFNKLDLQPLLFVAAVLGLGAVLRHSALAETLLERYLVHLPFAAGADGLNFALIGLGGSVLSLLTTAPGVPAILVPLAGDLAGLIGWPTQGVLATIVVGYSISLLPYQLPPIVIGCQLAGIPWRIMFRLLAVHAVVSILVALPLQYAWLRALGVLPG